MVKVKSSLRAMVGNSGGMSFFCQTPPFFSHEQRNPYIFCEKLGKAQTIHEIIQSRHIRKH